MYRCIKVTNSAVWPSHFLSPSAIFSFCRYSFSLSLLTLPSFLSASHLSSPLALKHIRCVCKKHTHTFTRTHSWVMYSFKLLCLVCVWARTQRVVLIFACFLFARVFCVYCMLLEESRLQCAHIKVCACLSCLYVAFNYKVVGFSCNFLTGLCLYPAQH